MAFVDRRTQIPPGKKKPGSDFIYNVGMTVGPNRANLEEDVLLVQYFLKKVWARPGEFAPPFPPPPEGDMLLDGKFGRITARWITAFQRTERSRGHPCAVDGRVDSAPPGGQNEFVVYTIAHLNNDFLVTYPEIPFDAIAANDPDCPPGLVRLFSSANSIAEVPG
jgi:hypothetical protein